MRIIVVCIVVLFAGLDLDAQVVPDNLKRLLKSKDYTVIWNANRPRYQLSSELTIGYGNGHGGSLGWIRFVPGKINVVILSVEFDEGWHPYTSKWPPDRAPVSIKSGNIDYKVYRSLLSNLAFVASAKLKPKLRNSVSMSSSDFWVSAKLTSRSKTVMDLDWAGYWSSTDEIYFAKSRAAVKLVRGEVDRLVLKPHTLTDDERHWGSLKFVNDWKVFENREFYWWIRERYIVVIGVIGNRIAIPTLIEIMNGDPKQRYVYHAVNALTRLLKKDVRSKPVEEMDVEKSRKNVLELIHESSKSN